MNLLPKSCEICERLKTEYQRKQRGYQGTLHALRDRTSAPATEYRRLKFVSDEARIEAEVARLEWEKHRRTH